VPLQAALLFDSVHDLATSEERRRIAREIHDGIAQDIAFLGYTADEIVDLASPGEMRDLGLVLRTEISRVLGGLRQGLFRLRDAVPGTRTLGSSISDFARRLFQADEVQVHVVLEESPRRLRPGVETELLRIAQEALTNARRHSGARNVWVECRGSAPRASVAVADDGTGVSRDGSGGGSGRFGLEIMAERARRIRADFAVSPRPEGGTVVRVEV
jgi:signal transduction histidine kinase